MTAPIIVYRPRLLIQPLDEAGADVGAAVDVSCDISSVELSPDLPLTDVTTFCGTFSIPGELGVTATLEVTVNEDTDANWSPLVGDSVRFELYDTATATRYRKWNSQIGFNPSLFGSNTPGEARITSFDVPVLSAVEWDEES